MVNALFLDTNILIDMVCKQRPGHNDAKRLARRCAQDGTVLVGAASSLKDLYYIVRRHYMSESEVRLVLERLATIVEFVPLCIEDVLAAVRSDEPDVEDGIVRALAESRSVGAIITRDADAYAMSDIPAMDCGTWLTRVGG